MKVCLTFHDYIDKLMLVSFLVVMNVILLPKRLSGCIINIQLYEVRYHEKGSPHCTAGLVADKLYIETVVMSFLKTNCISNLPA